MPKHPLDPFPYPRDARSRPIDRSIRDRNYVYVQDVRGVVYVLPDGSHLHPKVLGHAEPAAYAGDLRVLNGGIADITNLSGTFQFDDPDGLLEIADTLESQGFVLLPNAVRFFPMDGSPPLILK